MPRLVLSPRFGISVSRFYDSDPVLWNLLISCAEMNSCRAAVRVPTIHCATHTAFVFNWNSLTRRFSL